MNKELVTKLMKALAYSIISILSFIFVTPLKLWLKSAERLNAQKEAGTLNLANIKSEWLLFSYLKRFTLDFYFDAMAFLAYPLGFLIALALGIESGVNQAEMELSVSFGSLARMFMKSFTTTLAATYFAPVACYILHDVLVVFLLPIRKFIDWAKKPAQQLGLDIKNK